MVVVTFRASGRDNCVTVDGTPYMFVRTEQGSFVLSVKCRHRGGPLNLGTLLPGQNRIRCPWHERITSVSKAIRKGIPAVRREQEVTTVLSAVEDAACEWTHRPVSTGLAFR